MMHSLGALGALSLSIAPPMALPGARLPLTVARFPAARMVATGSSSLPSNPAELLKTLTSAGPTMVQRLTSPEARELQKELAELALEQDPQVIFRRSIDLARALRTVGIEAAESAAAAARQGGGTPLSAADLNAPMLLRRLCEELGATYVKLGQFIASSPTLFPPEYVQEFQKTLDATPPMAWATVRPIIEEQLGRPLSAVYASVEPTPLAAASIAQVHAATLLSGEDVVIKVQKAGVQGSLRADLDLLYGTTRVLQLLGLVTAELSEVVDTLRAAILEEIDFTLEAERTEQFAEFLARSPELAGLVTVPRVYRSASAARVLTLERLYGVSMTDLDAVRQYSSSPETAVIVALNTWVSSVLTNEWFHADVHAGNLLMLKDGRVAFIDFGIVGAIPRSTADAMVDFVRAFPQNDLRGVARALEGMGFTKELDDATSAAFAADLQEVLDSIEAMPPAELAAGVVDETQLNRAVAAVGRVAQGYGIRFPREFALLIKQVLYFDR
jgi:aarF domain-containing kinase